MYVYVCDRIGWTARQNCHNRVYVRLQPTEEPTTLLTFIAVTHIEPLCAHRQPGQGVLWLVIGRSGRAYRPLVVKQRPALARIIIITNTILSPVPL